jgi:hypothetical protein
LDKHNQKDGHEQAERLRQEANFDEGQARRLKGEARHMEEGAEHLKEGAQHMREEARRMAEEAERMQEGAVQMEKDARRFEGEGRILDDRAQELKDEASILDDQDDGGGCARDTVRFVISANGQPVTFEAGLDEPLAAVRARALELSNNLGRPADDWDLIDRDEKVLDLTRLVRDCGFGEEAFLFLSLKAGAAGER